MRVRCKGIADDGMCGLMPLIEGIIPFLLPAHWREVLADITRIPCGRLLFRD
ncbi:MAG: hypothetical protein JWQ21_1431 [Herminiimonas sp.]|nr:hypothetical protein [Herminiimonas sp.]